MHTLKHSKSTLAEGISLLLWLGLTVIVVGCFQIFMYPAMWPENRLFAMGFLVAEALIGLLVAWAAMAKIRRNETFVCILDEELIECVCPLKTRGDSFRLKLKDLVRIEQAEDNDSHRWYLHDQQGHRYWLTHAYRNPADRFVDRIRKLVPDVPQIRS